MKKEHDIVALVLRAKEDSLAADELIGQYMPFIRAEAGKVSGRICTDGDDELSIAMFAFYEAIVSYEQGRGAFLKLAARAIKNRLIDNRRKQRRHDGLVPLDAPAGDEDGRSLADMVPAGKNELAERQEREAARQEIEHFSVQLAGFGLALADISDNCPKQERTLAACMRVLDYAREHTEMIERLLNTGKLPVAQLSEGSGVDKKTIERHRKYLVAVLLAYTNGFEIIRGHLSMIKRKESASL